MLILAAQTPDIPFGASMPLYAGEVALALDGICTSAAGLQRDAKIPYGLMFGRNATLKIGRSHARAEAPAVLELIGSGRIAAERVNSSLGAIDDAPRALREHAEGNAIKTVLLEC